MKKTILRAASMVMALIGSGQALALGGDRVDNGGGLAEKNFVFAFANLERYMQTCLNLEGCRLTENERALLTRMIAAMPAERSRPDMLVFGSEHAHPGFFRIDGEIKLAKTGSKVGTPVYVNTDLLYARNALGIYEPLSLIDAVASLVHEFGHHHGNDSHTSLDVLGLKVASQMRRLTYETPLLPMQSSVSLQVLNGASQSPLPETLLFLTDEIVDLTQSVRNAVNCPAASLPISIGPIPPITIPGKKPRAFLLHNLHWRKINDEQDFTYFEAQGNLTLDCKKSELENGNTNYQLRIRFSASKLKTESGLKWVYRPESLSMEQARESWFKLFSILH